MVIALFDLVLVWTQPRHPGRESGAADEQQATVDAAGRHGKAHLLPTQPPWIADGPLRLELDVIGRHVWILPLWNQRSPWILQQHDIRVDPECGVRHEERVGDEVPLCPEKAGVGA